jgi:hypothetical protein
MTAARRTGMILGSFFAAPLFVWATILPGIWVAPLRFLLVFDLPGIVASLAIDPALPKSPPDGDFFPGLGRKLAIAAACDWLFYAFVFYAVWSHWYRRRSAARLSLADSSSTVESPEPAPLAQTIGHDPS